tara:strand:+ start:480 stop:2021 length:1542 start_codon:yes stop_codon:yes gene_type:complete
MKRYPIFVLIVGLIVAIIIVVSLMGTFIRLLIFNPVLLIGTILVIPIIFHYGWPYYNDYTKKLRSKKLNINYDEYTPKSRKDAAQKSLDNIDIIIKQLQFNVSKESIKLERIRIEDELNRGDLIVLIFGCGSTGKTSLTRALLNRIVGKVGAPMGSTIDSNVYKLRLKGIQRAIKLIDTPGIFETSKQGKDREKESKNNAIKSDLIIFIVDCDLRAAEMETLKSLSAIGKKIILVLNKCDLRGEEEERKLIYLLKSKCNGIISPDDIIPISASPQSIPITGKKPMQPRPEINKLLTRLSKVLHEEGEELIADNILLQCSNLGLSGKELLSNQRSQEAKDYVERYSWISCGIVIANPLPVIDLLGTAAINVQMVIELAKVYGIELSKENAQELVLSLVKTFTSLGIVKGGVSILSSALSINLPTLIVGKAIQGVAAAWLTRIAGDSFITYFKQDQNWGDGGIQEVVQKHYELNKKEASLKNFLNSAFNKFVDPLQRKHRKQLPPRRRPRGGAGA